MTSDRLERAVQSMHSISISLATLVVAAIGADKASTTFDLGAASHALLYASLACFVVCAVAGGHLITQLPLMDGEVDEVMTRKAPLVGGEKRGFIALKVGQWREIQHGFMVMAILLGAAGGLATATAEDVPGANGPAAPAAAHASAK